MDINIPAGPDVYDQVDGLLVDIFSCRDGLPSLESITVRARQPDAPSFSLDLGDVAIPNLRYVSLVGVSAYWGANASVVTQLVLCLPYGDGFVTHLMAQLCDCVNLQSLQLCISTGSAWYSPATPALVHLPCLRDLCLAYMERPCAAELLKLISAPALESLQLCEIDGPTLGAPEDLVSDSDLLSLVSTHDYVTGVKTIDPYLLDRSCDLLAGAFKIWS